MSVDVSKNGEVPSVYERLAEQFDIGAHKKVKKGGREQTYIPWTDKVERFNQVLGQDWSFRIIREGMTDTEAWVLGELTVTIDGVTTVRQQYGCESITRGQNASPVTDLFKIAGTDALSKAATLFGCGLYLSIQEERAEVEAAMQEAVRAAAAEARRPKAPAPTTAAAPGTQGSRSASTPTASSAKPTSSSTATTPAPLTPEVDAAAQLTGAPARPKTAQEWWAELVQEAERVKLPTLRNVKAIDPKACPEPQLRRHCDRLDARLRELSAGAA